METSKKTSKTASKKRSLSTLNLTLIGLVVAQLGIIIFLVKHSRFFQRSANASSTLISVLEADLTEAVPNFVQEPVIDYGPSVLPFVQPPSILVVYKAPQPVAIPTLDVQMSRGEKEIVLDLSAPPAEFAKPVKKAKTKIAKSQGKEKKASSQTARQPASIKHEKREKREKVVRQPKVERVKISLLPPKRSAQKGERAVASIAHESSLAHAASVAADESYHENSSRSDARRKEMARETERVKGVFQEE